jgi:hypothetical protein
MTQMQAAQSDCDDPDGFCGCPICESAILCVMVDDVRMSAQEAKRWALAALFAGRQMRCVR